MSINQNCIIPLSLPVTYPEVNDPIVKPCVLVNFSLRPILEKLNILY